MPRFIEFYREKTKMNEFYVLVASFLLSWGNLYMIIKKEGQDGCGSLDRWKMDWMQQIWGCPSFIHDCWLAHSLVISATAKTQHQVQGRLLLDVVVRQCATILQLLAGEDL